MPNPNKIEAFGVEFNKISGSSIKPGLATVINEDEFISFDARDNIIFPQEYHVVDVPPENNDFVDIARFNESDIEFIDILDNKIAIARWSYGDGKILFFSDFDANYLAGNFQEIIEGSAQRFANAACFPIDFSNIERDNLIKIDRLVIYNSKPLKMVTYLWQ